MHNVRFLDIKSQVVIMGLRIMPSLSFAFLSAYGDKQKACKLLLLL